MTSSRDLAVEKRLLRAITEFANTGPSSRDWLRLKPRWPGLLPDEVYELPFNYVLECNRLYGDSSKPFSWEDPWDLLRPGMSIEGVPGIPRFQLDPLILQTQLS
jgi:hypothetical protein